MVNRFKLKTLYHFTLNIAVQCFYVGIFFWGDYMGKLLVKYLYPSRTALPRLQ
jgi:hypothetical protein